MAIRTKAQLENIYLTTTGTWPDNSIGDITPSDLRVGVQDVIDSLYDYNDDASGELNSRFFNNTFNNVTVTGAFISSGTSTFGNSNTGNYTQYNNNGFPTNYGSGCAWDDLRIPGETVGTAASAPDRIDFVNTSGLQVYGFDGGATSETIFFSCQVPHNSIANPTLHPHIHWTPTTNATGYVKWFLQYTWADIGGVFQAPVILSGIGLASGAAWKHTLTDFPEISGRGSGVSSMLMCRMYRTPTDNQDTYAADAAFLEFDFHYLRDSNGSRSEYTK
jgi:hypothetical protein